MGVESQALDRGRSLARSCGAAETHRDTVYAEMGCDRMLRTERFKLMWGSLRSTGASSAGCTSTSR